MQTLHPIFMKVPRILCVLVFTAIYLIAAIAGREHFGEILSDFASLLSCKSGEHDQPRGNHAEENTDWTAFFTVIMLLEFLWFRRKSGSLGEINPDHFNDFAKLPPGYACCAAILVAIGGCVPSMAESGLPLLNRCVVLTVDRTWYTGPIALMVSKPYGGDLGFEFSAVFTFVSYLILRNLEIRYFGR